MITEQNEKYHESVEKLCESSLKQSQSMSTQNNNSNLISVENKLTFWQIDDLISTLINKLTTAVLETDRQYNYHIKETDSEMKYLIWMLSLQVTTWSKIRLTANNFISYKKTLNSFSQKIVFSSIFISEFTSYNNLNFSKKNTIILNLIKNIQEFNLQCR